MRERSTLERSALMARIRSRDTRPELIVRNLAHRLGYRFRLHRRDLPGSPDLVFPSRRKVIFVHGCFWHRHDCPLGRKTPSARPEYWLPKLERNQRRDAAALEQIASLGWSPLVIWECELKQMLEDELADRLHAFLGGARRGSVAPKAQRPPARPRRRSDARGSSRRQTSRPLA